jgi:hypothetical protein
MNGVTAYEAVNEKSTVVCSYGPTDDDSDDVVFECLQAAMSLAKSRNISISALNVHVSDDEVSVILFGSLDGKYYY